MTARETTAPNPEEITFMNFPLCTDLDSFDADFAILSIPFGAPYSKAELHNDPSNAPAAIRRESLRLSPGLEHWDFDLGGPLFDGRDVKVFDCGDIPANPADIKNYYRLAEEVVRTILEHDAHPIVLGGDHGVPIPVFRALDRYGPLNLIHVDAHIDWRDEANSVWEGFSSPVRRASEMPHIGRIFQIGMRAQGSARTREVEDARAYGAEIITAYDVHDGGIDQVLARIPGGERYYLTIDVDGLDPSIMPAVDWPAPGGLSFHQVRRLIHGLTHIGRLVGMDIVEITPGRDLNGITALTAGQLILNFIGATVRANYF